MAKKIGSKSASPRKSASTASLTPVHVQKPTDLSLLHPDAFQHLVNALALRVLGNGVTEFGPGADGGRDGLFVGKAPYPSTEEQWEGTWYIQSKFRLPSTSGNSQKWLLDEVKKEIKHFHELRRKRIWPDVWLIATNVDPSPTPSTGAFDRIKAMVHQASEKTKVEIWGATKISNFLDTHADVAKRYAHFLTSGHVLQRIYESLHDEQAAVHEVLDFLVRRGLDIHQHTRLQEAGSKTDRRPGIHKVFVDLPFRLRGERQAHMALQTLLLDSAENHILDSTRQELCRRDAWAQWMRHPERAPVWFIKGGPGQGKSTIGQYLCQLNRAALLLSTEELSKNAHPTIVTLANEIKESSQNAHQWPIRPRIPIYIELRQYAQWAISRDGHNRSILAFLGSVISSSAPVEKVQLGTIKRMLPLYPWIVVFDGLDEVPSDVRDLVAQEVKTFLLDHQGRADMLVLCTSRPQGYRGQFDDLYGVASVEMSPLTAEVAIECASRIISIERSDAESRVGIATLRAAMQSTAVQDLMTTPLQAHIMAVLVRGGQRPPERKWKLYQRFYEVIRDREASRRLVDSDLANLLQHEERLLRAVHSRLGYVLHAKAETATGAMSSLDLDSFRGLVESVVRDYKGETGAGIVQTVLEAARDRLVLISTPEDSEHVRFDIRQLQEFFAADYLTDGATPEEIHERILLLARDPHWREVIHFTMSALLENNRRAELIVARDALREIDSNDGTNEIYFSRLARGAFTVARLLHDGVLEQDRKLREPFAERLVPLVSLVDLNALSLLCRISGEASNRWLRETLVHQLSRLPAELVTGAGFVLWATSGADDPHLARLEDFLLTGNRSALYHYALAGTLVLGLKMQPWHETLLFSLLENPPAFFSDDDLTQLNRLLLAGFEGGPRYLHEGPIRDVEDFWTRLSERCDQLPAESKLQSMLGLIALARRSMDMVNLPHIEDLRLLVRGLDGLRRASLLIGAPFTLRFFRHADVRAEPLETELDQEIRSVLNWAAHAPGSVYFDGRQIGVHLRDSSDLSHLATVLKAEPTMVRLLRPEVWGELFKRMPDDIARVLRGEIFRKHRDSRLRFSVFDQRPHQWLSFEPFTLHLPEEACLLPQILAALVSSLIHATKTNALGTPARLSELMRVYVPGAAASAIIEDESVDVDVRVSMAIAVSCRDGIDLVSQGLAHVGLMNQAAGEGSPLIYVYSVFVDLAGYDVEDPRLASLMAGILEKAQRHIPLASRMDRLLSAWRERSSAVVNRRGGPDAWPPRSPEIR